MSCIQGCFFSHRLESAIPLLQREIMRASLPDVTIAFPDDGAYKRFYTMFEQYPSITCLKIREGDKRIVKIKEGMYFLT